MRKIKHTHSVARLRAVKHANKIRARLHAEFANNGVQPIAGAAS